MAKKSLLSFFLVITIISMGSSAKNLYAHEAEKDELHLHGHEYVALLSESVAIDDINEVKALFPECPKCLAMLTSAYEYDAYIWNSSQHAKDSFVEFTFTCWPQHDKVTYKITNNPKENHTMHYMDLGCYNKKHTYKPYCICGYTKDNIVISCPGGPHSIPARIRVFE